MSRVSLYKRLFTRETSKVESERVRVKRWLRGLREDQKMSRATAADALEVTPETIRNLEHEKRGFANGFTLLGYLRLLGVLVDSPVDLPGISRLEAIQADHARGLAAVAASLAAIDDRLSRIEERLGLQAGPTHSADDA